MTRATGRAKQTAKGSNGVSRSSKPYTGKRPLRKDYGMIPPAIAGLLESLPPEGEGWTKAQREKFMVTFGSVLDFVIPVKEPGLRLQMDEADDTDDDE